jgi:DNA-binding MarR family transcriptional regulator
MSSYQPKLTTSRPELLVKGSDEQFRRMLYMLVQSVSRLLAFRDAFGRQLDITPGQFAVLMSVAHLQGAHGVSIRDIADHVAMAAPHVTTEVGKLEKAGFVHKKPSPFDGRSVLVSLSRNGRNAVETIMPLVCEVNDTLFAELDAKTMAKVHDFVSHVVANADVAMAQLRRRYPARKSSSKGL